MEYGRIISESFRISWRYKSLWVFGLFAGSIGAGFSFDPSARDLFTGKHGLREAIESAGSVIGLEFVFAWVFVIAVFGLILMAIHLVCLPALIDGVNKIKRGGLFRWSSSLSAGLNHFWRFLGLAMISIMLAALGFGLSVVVGMALPDVDTAILAITALLFLPVTLFIGFILTSIFALAQRAMVVRNVGIADGLHEGFELLRRNFLKCLLIFLIYIGASIGIAFGAILILGIVAIPIVLLALLVESAWVLVVILGFIVGLPLLLVLIAFATTFLQNLYTLFYFELVEPGGLSKPGPAALATPLA